MTKNKDVTDEIKCECEIPKFLITINGIQYFETSDGHVWMFTKDGELECLTHSESYRVRD